MGVKAANFKIGDLVVQKNADFLKGLIIGKVSSIEYIDELSDMWIEDYDEEPYYLYDVSVVYVQGYNYIDLDDVVCYEEVDLFSISEFLAHHITLDEYIQYYCENNF